MQNATKALLDEAITAAASLTAGVVIGAVLFASAPHGPTALEQRLTKALQADAKELARCVDVDDLAHGPRLRLERAILDKDAALKRCIDIVVEADSNPEVDQDLDARSPWHSYPKNGY